MTDAGGPTAARPTAARPTASRLAAAHGLDASAGTPGGEGAVAGTDVEYRFDPQHTCELLADALVRLHRIGAEAGAAAGTHAGPEAGAGGVVERLDPAAVLALAEARLAAGTVADVDRAYAHVDAERLLEALRAGTTALECPTDDLVLTHGNPTLDTLRCRAGRAVGFDAWQDAAVADRHRDLAVAATAVAAELGPMLVPLLLDRYGRRPDPVRLDWWALAHQLTRPRPGPPG